MDRRTRERLVASAEVLKTVSSPVRLFILEQLTGKDCCVAELAADAGISPPAVSWHLSRMRNAGVLGWTRRGKEVFYGLRSEAILLLRSAAESIMVRRTRRFGTLCRMGEKAVRCERRTRPKRGGRSILKGRVF